jgi:DNA-directed RNA polymerase beta' subunit
MQKLATAFLDINGFSVGVSDCIVDNDPINYKALEEHLERDYFARCWTLDDEATLTDALSEMTKLQKPDGIVENRLLDMIDSGSKGSIINFNQITRVVGQQMGDEGRISSNRSNNTRPLPHFHKHDRSIKGKGFVKSSFIKGLDPIEFFNHAQGGRIGLISTSCKTATTGYTFRKLVKTLEPLVVRDAGYGNRLVQNSSTGNVVQTNYGGDSIDGLYLKKKK